MKSLFAVLGLLLAGISPLSAQSLADQALSVEAQVATAIVDRMPFGSAAQFPVDVGELFVWTRVTGAGGTSIEHVWIHDGNEYPVTLPIGGSPWRTWSNKVIPTEWVGAWTVEVRSEDGTVLETLHFTVG